MTLTKSDREILQVYRDADEDGKLFIFDMLICAATCGEEFFKELQATPQEPAALRAVVTKYVATVKEAVAV